MKPIFKISAALFIIQSIVWVCAAICIILALSGCATVSKAKIMRERSNYYNLVEKERANKYPSFLDWSKK